MKIKLVTILAAALLFNGLALAQETGQPVVTPLQQNKISLDIKGMDVVDVLKMLATRASMNIVVGKNVTGRVTLFLKDVDVWDAFEIILLANDLAYEKTGAIINVMAQRDYELLHGERYQDKKQAKIIQLKYAKAADLSRALNQIKTNIGKIVVDEASNTLVLVDLPAKVSEMEEFIKNTDLQLNTQVFNLNYAQADKLSPKLQEILTKGLGSIKIDERTNKIAVTDYPDKLKEIAKIVTAFDEKTMQVLIDAQIVEINPKKDEFAMGVDWDYWLKKNLRLTGSFPAPALTSASVIPMALSYGIAALGNSSASPSAPGQYSSVLDMVRVIGETKILSSPRLMVLNNQEARILVGSKEAYITSTTSQAGSGSTVTSQSVNFVDVGLKLYVTPVANKDGFVTMKIRPEVSSSVTTTLKSQGTDTQIPIVTTSETETTVMVKDGTTIIIAGLKKDKDMNEIKKIPFFADIPLLGAAFRNVKHEKTKIELVIFITPHIVSGAEPLEYVSLTDNKDITQIQSMAEATQKQKNNLESSEGIEYKNFVINKIKSCSAPLQGTGKGKGKIEVSFVLKSDGSLKGDPVVMNSSDQSLNSAALSCVKNAVPFPGFPETLKKDEETFRLSLAYQ